MLLTLLPVAVGAKPRTTADMKKTAARAINLQTTLSAYKTGKRTSSGTRSTEQLRELKTIQRPILYMAINKVGLP